MARLQPCGPDLVRQCYISEITQITLSSVHSEQRIRHLDASTCTIGVFFRVFSKGRSVNTSASPDIKPQSFREIS